MNRRSIDQELFEAAGENISLPEARRLLRAGADIEAKDNLYGSTPLIIASRWGHVLVVKEFLEYGADIEAEDINGKTPLDSAASVGLLAVVNELLERGADTEAKDVHGWTPLHASCWNGHLAVVNELLGPNDHYCATTSILGKRKSRGANVEAKDNDGNTPLHYASLYGCVVVVQALLSGGANILAADNDGILPVHFAVRRFGSSAVAKCLLQQMYATTRRLPLHELVEDLTWIDNPDSSDVPPLRTALDQDVFGTDDVVEILDYLVGRNPALLTSRDQDGSLPLHVACRRGASFTIVQSLANHYKASVKSVTCQGDLPLFLACQMPETTSLDTIFLLMKLYPDLVYR
jgi:ankyrin repeat protein